MPAYDIYLVRYRPEVAHVEVHSDTLERAVALAKARVSNPSSDVMTPDEETVTDLFAFRVLEKQGDEHDPFEGEVLFSEQINPAQILRELRIGDVNGQFRPSGHVMGLVGSEDK